jgi:hypothetical protein
MLCPNQVIRADDSAHALVDVAVRRTGEPGDVVLETVTSEPWWRIVALPQLLRLRLIRMAEGYGFRVGTVMSAATS